MRHTFIALLGAATVLAGFAAPLHAQEVVTIYSADGLKDGPKNWYTDQFDAFTKATGIKVQYIEDGSGGVVARVAKEKSNPQADVLVTLPPFIQRAAAQKLLQPQFKDKLQYSTPGQAGDGTAVMLEVIHAFGGKDAGFKYLKELQANNRGPSASTGKLTALVNKGELLVATGDLQMNIAQMQTNPNIQIFFPAGPDGKRSTLALPYDAGLVAGAPHAANGRKLIDWLLSKSAQEEVTSVAQGLPVRSDVKPSDQSYKDLTAKLAGVTVWTPDWTTVVKEFDADVARWHDATGS